MWLCVCVLPGHVDSHILMRGSGQDTEQLVEDGGQKVDHDMTFHRMKALRGKGGTLDVTEKGAARSPCGETEAADTFRYLISSPSEACSDISML